MLAMVINISEMTSIQFA